MSGRSLEEGSEGTGVGLRVPHLGSGPSSPPRASRESRTKYLPLPLLWVFYNDTAAVEFRAE